MPCADDPIVTAIATMVDLIIVSLHESGAEDFTRANRADTMPERQPPLPEQIKLSLLFADSRGNGEPSASLNSRVDRGGIHSAYDMRHKLPQHPRQPLPHHSRRADALCGGRRLRSSASAAVRLSLERYQGIRISLWRASNGPTSELRLGAQQSR